MTPNPTERRRTTDELFELTLRRGRTLRRRRRLAVGGVGALALAGLVPVTIAVIDRDDPDRLVVADGTEGGDVEALLSDTTTTAVGASAPTTIEQLPTESPIVVDDVGIVPVVTGLLEAAAIERVEAAELIAQVTYVDVDAGSPDVGRVINQNPPSGSVMARSVVTLVVGQQTSVAPAVTGLSADSAQSQILQAGFVPFVIFQDLPAGSADIGRVLSQDPAAGTQLPAGGAVTIVVGRVGG